MCTYIYIIIIILIILINSDNDILSTSKKQIIIDLQLNEKKFGFFFSFTSLGRMVGSIIFPNQIKKDKRKF